MSNSSAPSRETVPQLLLGQLLIHQGLIQKSDLDKAFTFQAQYGGRLGSVLVRLGALSEDSLLPVLSTQLGMALIDSSEIPTQSVEITQAIEASGLATDWFIDQQLAIWEDSQGGIQCIARDPLNALQREVLTSAFPDRQLVWYLARTQDVEGAIKLVENRTRTDHHDEVAHLRELAEEAPVIEFVANMMAQSIDEGASDIHIEPGESTFEIRFRVDGVLQTRMAQPRSRFDAVASRIKLVSGMDIAERRLPQDGRMSIRAGGVELDVRVSTLPGVHGESIVLRLLPKERSNLDLEWLGLERDHHEYFSQLIAEPHGIVLVTGPTGSGKSTSLYAALSATNDGLKKIVTVEDPVEFKLPGITQVQTHSEIGYDFARALRAILRQDPDVIMIGEIRDLETAEIAVQAALTGHMVLSTLHTNDAPSAFTRLLDMGVEPFLMVSSVVAIQAQRLVRRLCPNCAGEISPAKPILDAYQDLQRRFPELLPLEPRWLEGAGCHACQGKGYRGRIGIYEFVRVTSEIQQAVMARASTAELVAIARQQGYRNLREDGLIKASQGRTSIEEVLRVTGAADSE